MKNIRHCFALDLQDEPMLIEKYKEYHAAGKVWPEVTKSIRDSGIEKLEIFLTGNRLFMIMEVNQSFDPIYKAQTDAENTHVQEWEELMWKFQKPLPWAEKGQKWVPMERIFNLGDQ